MESTLQSIAERLVLDQSKGDSLQTCLQACKELRDRGIEAAHSPQHYPKFLAKFFPLLQKLLTSVPPKFEEGLHHELRHTALDILHRLPQTDLLKPYVPSLLDLSTSLLQQDNEENALVCLGIVFDLHKTYRPNLDDQQIQPFFIFVQDVYSQLPTAVTKFLSVPVSPAGSKTKLIPPSQESFRVLTECPLIIMLLFQLNRSSVPRIIPKLVPLMVECIKLKAGDAFLQSKDLQERKEIRERYTHFMAAQVKTLSFLTYLVRSSSLSGEMVKYTSSIASSVAQLLKYCLPEASSVRKDLLVATRHILATKFRTGFTELVDLFLDESLLLGSSFGGSSNTGPQPLVPTKEQSMLPLAYSTLADLIHHVKNRLTLAQLSKVVYIFSRNVHDPVLPVSTQLISVKLLLNIVESIFHNNEREVNSGRQLLVLVLHAIVTKLGSLRYYIPEVISHTRERRKSRLATAATKDPSLDFFFYTCPQASKQSSSTASSSPNATPPEKSGDAANLEDHKIVLIKVPDAKSGGDTSSTTSSSSTAQQSTMAAEFQDLEDALSIGKDPAISVGSDEIKDVQSLIETMLRGLRTVLWCVCNFGPKKYDRDIRGVLASMARTSNGNDAATKKALASVPKPPGIHGLLTNTEMQMISDLLEWGFQCITVFRPGVVEVEDHETFLKAAKENGVKQSQQPSHSGTDATFQPTTSPAVTASGNGGSGGNNSTSASAAAPSSQSATQGSSSSLPSGHGQGQGQGKEKEKKTDKHTTEGNGMPAKAISKRQAKEIAAELEVINLFADIFTVLDPHNFNGLFRSKIGLVLANTIRHPTLIAFTKRLLRKASVSHSYLGILLDVVTEKLPTLPGMFGIPPGQLAARFDFCNILSSDPETRFPLDFKNVPLGGPLAACSYYGIGLDIHFENTSTSSPAKVPTNTSHEPKTDESNTASTPASNVAATTSTNSSNNNGEDTPKNPKKRPLESKHRGQSSVHQQQYHQSPLPGNYQENIFRGQTVEAQNYAAVLAQMVEAAFSCIENETDDPVAGPAPASMKRSPSAAARKQQAAPSSAAAASSSSSTTATGTPPGTSSGRGSVTPGWMIGESFQEKFEKIVVLCFALAPGMTTSTQVSIRGMLPNSILGFFLSRERETSPAKSLVNHQPPPSQAGLPSVASTMLGRDCYLLTLKSLMRVVLRRTVIQDLCKQKLDILLVPALNALSHLLSQAGGPYSVSGTARKDLIAEIMLLFAVRIPRGDLQRYLPLVQDAFEVAMNANSHRNTDLSRLALKIIENWVDSVGPDALRGFLIPHNTASNQGNTTFVHALNKLLKPSPQPCITGALRLLGKLGKRGRTALLETPASEGENHNLQEKTKALDRVLVVELFWESGPHGSFANKKKSMHLCLDQMVRHAKSFIEDTFSPLVAIDYSSTNVGGSQDEPRSVKKPKVAGDRDTEDASEGASAPTFDDEEEEDIFMSFPKASTVETHTWIKLKPKALLQLEHAAEYKAKAVDILLAGAAHFVDLKDLTSLPFLGPPSKLQSATGAFFLGKSESLPFMDTPSTAQSQGSATRKSAERALFVDILTGLAAASCDVDTAKTTWPIFRGLVQLLTIAGAASACDTSETHSASSDVGLGPASPVVLNTGVDLSSDASTSTSSGFRSRASSISSETEHGWDSGSATAGWARAPCRPGEGVDATVVNQVIVWCICTASPIYTSLALKMMRVVLSTGLRVVAGEGFVMPPKLSLSRVGPILQDLVERLCVACHDNHWTRRLGGCVGLRYLLAQLPYEWSQDMSGQLFEAFSFALETHELCHGEETFLHASSGLQELILICFLPDKPRRYGMVNSLISSHRAKTGMMDVDEIPQLSSISPTNAVSCIVKLLLASYRQSRQTGKDALKLIAYCVKTSLGTLLTQQSKVVEDLKTSLISRSIKQKPQLKQVAYLDAISFLLDQTPCPMDIMSDEKRVVQILIDAIMLSEAAERTSGGLSYLKCVQQGFSPKQSESIGGRNVSSILKSTPYPFLDIPLETQLRVGAIHIVRTFLIRGGTTLTSFLDRDPSFQRVRDRSIKLVVSSVLSCWPSVVQAAEQGLETVARTAGANVRTGNGDQPGIPANTLLSLVNSAATAIKPGTACSRSMLHGVVHLVKNFQTNQSIPSMVQALLRQLEQILNGTPEKEPVSPSSHPMIEDRLDHAMLAAGIIRVFVHLPRDFVVQNLKTLVQQSTRIINAPERLTLSRCGAVIPEIVDGRVAFPSTAPFYEIHGFLSSPLNEPLVELFNKYPRELLAIMLETESLKNADWLRLLKSLLRLPSATNLRRFVTGKQVTDKIIASMLEIGVCQSTSQEKLRELVLLAFQAVDLITLVIEYYPEWLIDQPALIERISAVWRSKQMLTYLRLEEKLSYSQRRYYSNVCHIFIAFFRAVAKRAEQAEQGDGQATQPSQSHTTLLQNASACVYHMLTLVVLRTTVDTTFLLRFLRYEVAQCRSSQLKIALIRHYVHLSNLDSVSPFLQEAALRLIVIPLLAAASGTGPFADPTFRTSKLDLGDGHLMGTELIRRIIQTVQATPKPTADPDSSTTSSSSSSSSDAINSPTTIHRQDSFPTEADKMDTTGDDSSSTSQSDALEGDAAASVSTGFTLGSGYAAPESLYQSTSYSRESLQVQLLQLATLLIARYGEELAPVRKQLIKFAWNHLKNEGSACKMWAYVSIATFIRVYDIPQMIALQVFIALLREHSPDCRDLIRQSLALIVPALAKTLDAQKYMRAIRATRRLIYEEGHKLPQLSHIWQLITNHPELYYQNRSHFLQQLLGSLTKLWNPQGGSAENRALAVDLAELPLKWEQTRYLQELNWESTQPTLEATSQMEVDQGSPSTEILSDTQLAAKDATQSVKLNVSTITMIVHFFLRISLLLSDSSDAESLALYRRCMNLFKVSLVHAARILKSSMDRSTSTSSTSSSTTSSSPSPSPPGAEERTLQVKSIINFAYIAKHVETILKKQVERAQNAEQKASSSGQSSRGDTMTQGRGAAGRSMSHASSSSAGTSSSYAPGGKAGYKPSAGSSSSSNSSTGGAQTAAASTTSSTSSTVSTSSKATNSNLQEEDPGTLCCVLEVLNAVLSADKDTIAGPFLREYAQFLHIIVRPVFGCAERGSRMAFLQFIVNLKSLRSALSMPKPSGSAQHSPVPIEQKSFNSVLFDAIDKRLLLAADDGKKLVTQSTQAHVKVQQNIQSAKQASKDQKKGKGGEKKTQIKSSNKGAAPKQQSINSKGVVAKGGKGKTGEAAALAGKGSKATASAPSKAAQQKAVKAAAVRKAREVGAGPLGTFHTIRLVQLLCLKSTPKELSGDPLSQNFLSSGKEYDNKRVDRFANSLMKILFKLSKDLIASASNRSKTASKTSSSFGGSVSILISSPAQIDETERLASKSVSIILDILSPRVLCLDAHRRPFLTQVYTLIDKLDVHDEEVLMTIIRLAGDWITMPLPSPQPPKRKASISSVSEMQTSKAPPQMPAESSAPQGASQAPSSEMSGNSPEPAKASSSSKPGPPKASLSKPGVTPHGNRLSLKERQGLIAKLEQIERFDELPQARRILVCYREMIFRVLDPMSMSGKNKLSWAQHLSSRFLPGLMSSDASQRKIFYRAFAALNLRNKGPFSRLQLLIQQDWSHFGTTNWLPVALQVLLSAVNQSSSLSCPTISTKVRLSFHQAATTSASASASEQHGGLVKSIRTTLQELTTRRTSGILLEAVEELCYGDRSCEFTLAAWLEVFPQTWNAVEEQQKMLLNEGFQVLLSRNYHLPESVVYFAGVQRSAVAVQHALEEISPGLLTQVKAWCIRNDVAWDPFQDALVQFSLRRVKCWERLSSWTAPGIVKCLLRGITLLRPIPIFSAEMLRFVGPSAGARAETLELSELLFHQVQGVRQSSRRAVLDSLTIPDSSSSSQGQRSPLAALGDQSKNTNKLKKKRKDKNKAASPAAAAVAAVAVAKLDNDKKNAQRWADALLHLYEHQDEDLTHGLIRQLGVAAPTFAGLSLEATGQWEKALQAYLQGIHRVEAGKGSYIVARRKPTYGADAGGYGVNPGGQGHAYAFDPAQAMPGSMPAPSGSAPQGMHAMGGAGGVGMEFLDDGMDFFDDLGFDFTDMNDPAFGISGGNDPMMSNMPPPSADPGAHVNQGYYNPGTQQQGGIHAPSHGSYAGNGQQGVYGESYNVPGSSPDGLYGGYGGGGGGGVPPPAIAWIPKAVSAPELRAWKDRWLQCARKLGKWDQVGAFANATKDYQGLMESAMRSQLPNWVLSVKQMLGSESLELQDLQNQTHQERPYLPLNIIPALLDWRSSVLQVAVAINDSRSSSDLDQVWRQAANAVVLEWAAHDDILGGGNRTSLLFSMQQLVELEESISYLSNISTLAAASRSLPGTTGGAQAAAVMQAHAGRSAQLKRLIDRWRDRMTDPAEEAFEVDRILMSRLFVFSMGTRSFEQSVLRKGVNSNMNNSPLDTLHPLQLKLLSSSHDTKWTVLERAKSYRTNGLVDESLSILSNQWIITRTMSSEDHYRLATEKALALVGTDSSPKLSDYQRHLAFALQGIASLDITDLNDKSQSEVFRIRALVQDALQDNPGMVHSLFVESIRKCRLNEETWLAWSRYASRLLERMEMDESRPWPVQDRDLYPIMASGILQALKLGSREARLQLGTVFWLLHPKPKTEPHSMDVGVTVPYVLSKYIKILPGWVWVPWVPHIISLLSMSDEHAEIGQELIKVIAQEHPDAMYYTLRAQYFDKDTEQRLFNQVARSSSSTSSSSSSSSSSSPPSTSSGADTSIVLMVKAALSQFHKDHPKEVFELEFLLEELSSAYKKQHPLEELYSTMHRLLEKCIQFATVSEIPPSGSKQSASDVVSLRCFQKASDVAAKVNQATNGEAERLNQVWGMLEKVCLKLFSSGSMGRSERHTAFLTRLRSRFERDFLPDPAQVESLKRNKTVEGMPADSQGRDMSIHGIIGRIGKWKEMLEDMLYLNRSKQVPLFEWSRNLAGMVPEVIEIPGAHFLQNQFDEPILCGKQRLFGLDGTVEISRQEGYSQPRLGFMSDSGYKVYYVAKTSQYSHTRSDQRLNLLRSILNEMFAADTNVKKRHFVRFDIPVVVPVHSRMCLQLDGPGFEDYAAIFEGEMERRGEASPRWRLAMRLLEEEKKAAASMGLSSGLEKHFCEIRKVAFEQVCRNVPEQLLFQHIRRLAKTAGSFLNVRDVFAKNHALSSLLVYLFSGFDRSPTRTLIDPCRGVTMEVDLRLHLKSGTLGDMEDSQSRMHVPFRLTPNIAYFLTPAGVDGPFANSMLTAASCMLKAVNLTTLKSFLNLHVLHELVDFNAANSPKYRDTNLFASRQLHALTRGNVNLLVNRLSNVSPDVNRLNLLPASVKDSLPEATAEQLEKEEMISDTSLETREPLQKDLVLAELISQATNPAEVALMDATWLPWF